MKNLLLTVIAFCTWLQLTAAPPSIAVDVSGQGRPVLFLPGFSCPGSVWKPVVTELGSGYETHLVTYAGFNHLPAVEMPWFPKLVQDLQQYIAAKNLRKLCIVGHSMGGNLAMELAAAMPDYVERILLVDAIPCMREVMMPGVSADQLAYDAPYNRQMLAMGPEALRQMATVMADNMTVQPQGKDSIVHWIGIADRTTYVHGYVDLLKLDQRDKVLPAIRARVRILAAPFPDKDIISANYEKQFARLAARDIAMAPGGRHFIMWDEPVWFMAQLRSFLQP